MWYAYNVLVHNKVLGGGLALGAWCRMNVEEEKLWLFSRDIVPIIPFHSTP